MAYSVIETQLAVNMAEQALQQRQIPFDIIFDQQMDKLGKYDVLVLADQECLSDANIARIKAFVKKGVELSSTGNTGKYDEWRRLRKSSLSVEMLSETERATLAVDVPAFSYGKGRVISIPRLIQPGGEIKLGFESVWKMPENANELESAVYWAAGKILPLTVSAPEWVGVSHDTQAKRDVIHLFSYSDQHNVAGITLQYKGSVKKAWVVSPDEDGVEEIPVSREGDISVLRISNLAVYKVLVLEK